MFQVNPNMTPIACDLSALTEAERIEQGAAWQTLRALAGVEQRPDGLILRLPPTDEVLGMLGLFISRERRCCPFFDFSLSVPHTGEAVYLSLTGPEGVREFLLAEMGIDEAE